MLVRYLILAVALIPVTGCVLPLGPSSLDHSTHKYNKVFQNTTEEQVLLNLVRMRYGEQPFFVEVASVTQQYQYDANISPNLRNNHSAMGMASLPFQLGMHERPTVIYQPLVQGEFYERLVKPVLLREMNLYIYSGWSAETVFRICMSYINDLDGGINAGRPMPPPIYIEDFKEFCALSRQLQEMGQFELQVDTGPGVPLSPPIDPNKVTGEDLTRAVGNKAQFAVVDDGKLQLLTRNIDRVRYTIAPEAVGSFQHQRIVELLNMKDKLGNSWELEPELVGFLKNRYQERENISVSRRSPMEMFYLLSNAVKVPEDHIHKGIVRAPGPGSDFVDDLLCVGVSKTCPTHAEVKVFFRGHWFYIASDDLASRYTFSFLTEVFNRNVRGAGGGAVPLFTFN